MGRIVSSVEPMLHPPHKLPSRFHSNPEEATSAELPSSRALTSCQLVTAKSPVPSPELPSPWRVFSTTTWPRSSPLLHGRSTLLRPRHHHQLRLLCHHSYQRRHLEARSCLDHRSPSCRTRVHRSRNHLRMGQDQRHQRSPPSQPPDTDVPLMSDADCGAVWGTFRITPQSQCVGLGGTGSCNGDSGSPLWQNVGGVNYLIGNTSWGSSTCNADVYPTIYSKSSAVISWIQSQM